MNHYITKIIAHSALIGGIILSLPSCNGNKDKTNATVFYGPEDASDSVESTEIEDNTEYIASEEDTIGGTIELIDEVVVPFVEKDGVKAVKVSINGCPTEFEMLIDSGCSSTLISLAEANYLYEKGYLTVDDIIGVTQAVIANGQIVNNMEVILRHVVIDGQIYCNDVRAQVTENAQAPLLLGNEILDRAASYSIDNISKNIIFRPL